VEIDPPSYPATLWEVSHSYIRVGALAGPKQPVRRRRRTRGQIHTRACCRPPQGFPCVRALRPARSAANLKRPSARGPADRARPHRGEAITTKAETLAAAGLSTSTANRPLPTDGKRNLCPSMGRGQASPCWLW
jgi:hypothetical protein